MIRRLLRCGKGTASVELALTLLPLLMMAFGAVEFGRALWIRHGLSNAAAAGERMLLLSTDPLSREAAVAAERRIRTVAGMDPDMLSVTILPSAWDGGQMVVLQIRYPVSLLLPAVRNVPLTLSVERAIPL